MAAAPGPLEGPQISERRLPALAAALPGPRRLAADVGAAASTALLVAPFVATIDKAIMKHAAGGVCMVRSIRASLVSLFTEPAIFARKPSSLLIWGVYLGTYSCANVLSSACQNAGLSHEAHRTAELVVVSGTLASLNIAKDRSLARRFGLTAPRPVPLSAMALFGTRDAMTVLAAFGLSPALAARLEVAGAPGSGPSGVACQLLVPMAMQWASSPLHLLGLNLYNNPGARAAERCRAVCRQYVGASIARSLRICPPFGIGVLLNAPVRDKLRRQFE